MTLRIKLTVSKKMMMLRKKPLIALLSSVLCRLIFPELTEERRKALAKDVKKKGDEAKVAIRNIRRDANEAFKKMNKNNELTEDDQKDLESQAQKMTDKYISDIDKAVEEKTKEIMTV